jgi:hypothetical protein
VWISVGSDIVGRVDHVVVVSKDGDRSLGTFGVASQHLEWNSVGGKELPEMLPH